MYELKSTYHPTHSRKSDEKRNFVVHTHNSSQMKRIFCYIHAAAVHADARVQARRVHLPDALQQELLRWHNVPLRRMTVGR